MSITAAQFAILGIAAFALTGLLTWPVRALAIRLGAMDAPNMARKTQAEPVPYLGGVAIALGISLITLGAVFVGADNFAGENNDQFKDLVLTVLLPALALGAMGLFDDLLAVESAAAFVVPSVETVALKRTASGTTEIVPTPVTVMKRLSAVPAPFAGIASATTPATAATVTAVRTVRSFVSFMA
jgi:UDP-N-acetylmuramyl pentapeptide phosphotransferase/UDP-N-acetylglucosamine-1-phosphate transferase